MVRGSGALLWIFVFLVPMAAGRPSESVADLPRGGKMPLRFVENRGQWDSLVRFVAARGGMTAYFTDLGFWLQLVRVDRGGERSGGVNLSFSFEGGSRSAKVRGRDRQLARHHYLLGSDPDSWVTDVPSFAAVDVQSLYRGVDLRFLERGGRLEYDLHLAPGAALDEVVVRCEGVDRIDLERDGSLSMETAFGVVRQTEPVAWECLPNGERRPVPCRFRAIDDRRYGFELERSDPSLFATIDPGLEWSTVLGGPWNDAALALALDPDGVITYAGTAISPNFPTTPGAFDTTHNSPYNRADLALVRLDLRRSGSDQLLWSTFVGGAGHERPNGIHLEPDGQITCGGWTESADFPITPGAYAAARGDLQDAFLLRLDPSRFGVEQLLFSTAFGGSDVDRVGELAVDENGVIHAVGETYSFDFPTTPGAFDLTKNGDPGTADAFLVQVDPSQTGSSQLSYSTFVGGAGEEIGLGIGLNETGAAVVAGSTASSDFPTTPGAFDPVYNGGDWDGFVACLDPSRPDPASQLVWSTFVGSTGIDQIHALAQDRSGRWIVGGSLGASDFLATPGAFDETFNGGGGCFPGNPLPSDAFLARLDSTGSSLDYATYLGGSCNEGVTGLAVRSGVVTAVGSVGSPDFPTTPGAYDRTLRGGGGPFGPYDLFIARLDPNLVGTEQLLYATFLGGADDLEARARVALDGTDAATVAGLTVSSDFPTTPDAYDPTHAGGEDAFVARLDLLPTGAVKRGESTPGCDGPLAVGVTGMPRVGNAAFGLRCTGSPSASIGFLMLGAEALATPIVTFGVALFVSPSQFDLIGVFSNGDGVAQLPAPLPADPSLIGLGAVAQFFWQDPCGAHGYCASNALEITVQP